MKVSPAGAGLDERQLERITGHFQTRYIDAGRIAGGQVAVARHGHVGYFRSFGVRDLERSAPVEQDTIWRIYSMTKPVTGVALMSLYERGMFQLSDPVTRFIPQWRDLKVREAAQDGPDRLVDPERPMTVRDLMMHMSGLGFGGGATLQELFSADHAQPGEGLAAGVRRGRGGTLQTMIERAALRRLPAGDHLRAARHERHRLHGARRQGRPVRRVLPPQFEQEARPGR